MDCTGLCRWSKWSSWSRWTRWSTWLRRHISGEQTNEKCKIVQFSGLHEAAKMNAQFWPESDLNYLIRYIYQLQNNDQIDLTLMVRRKMVEMCVREREADNLIRPVGVPSLLLVMMSVMMMITMMMMMMVMMMMWECLLASLS